MKASLRPAQIGWIVAAIVLWGYLAIMIIPAFWGGNHDHSNLKCLSNVKQQAIGAEMYASDHDGLLPVGDWVTDLESFVKNESMFHCTKLANQYGYAFNSNLLGQNLEAIQNPATIPLIYESTTSARSVADPVTSIPAKGRHDGLNAIAYADGHAKLLPSGSLSPAHEPTR